MDNRYWAHGFVGFHAGKVQSINWCELAQKIQYQFRRNGCHGATRNLVEAQRVFNHCIPNQAKMLGEDYIKSWMKGRDFSHIQARVNGGGHQANNIVMEKASLNRTGGGRNMTSQEVRNAKADGLSSVFLSGEFFGKVVGNTVNGAMAGAAFTAAESSFRNIWNAASGEIDWEEAGWNVLGDAKNGAIAGAAFAAGTTILSFAIPALSTSLLPSISPVLTVAGIGCTAWNIGSFIWGKLFPSQPKISLLVWPRTGELLIQLQPPKLILPKEPLLVAPNKKSLILPPRNPLVMNLDPYAA
jgi:hypothetical protein